MVPLDDLEERAESGLGHGVARRQPGRSQGRKELDLVHIREKKHALGRNPDLPGAAVPLPLALDPVEGFVGIGGLQGHAAGIHRRDARLDQLGISGVLQGIRPAAAFNALRPDRCKGGAPLDHFHGQGRLGRWQRKPPAVRVLDAPDPVVVPAAPNADVDPPLAEQGDGAEGGDMALDLACDDAQPVELFQGDAGGLLEGRPGRRLGQPRFDNPVSDDCHARVFPVCMGEGRVWHRGGHPGFFRRRQHAVAGNVLPEQGDPTGMEGLVVGKVGLEVDERGKGCGPPDLFIPQGAAERCEIII